MKPRLPGGHRERDCLAHRATDREAGAGDQRWPDGDQRDTAGGAPAVAAERDRAFRPRHRHGAQRVDEDRDHDRGDHHGEHDHAEQEAGAGEGHDGRQRLRPVGRRSGGGRSGARAPGSRTARRRPTASPPAGRRSARALVPTPRGASSATKIAASRAKGKATSSAPPVVQDRPVDRRPRAKSRRAVRERRRQLDVERDVAVGEPAQAVRGEGRPRLAHHERRDGEHEAEARERDRDESAVREPVELASRGVRARRRRAAPVVIGCGGHGSGSNA